MVVTRNMTWEPAVTHVSHHLDRLLSFSFNRPCGDASIFRLLQIFLVYFMYVRRSIHSLLVGRDLWQWHLSGSCLVKLKKIKIVTCDLETERKRDKDVEIILVLCGLRTWGINFPTLGLSKEIKIKSVARISWWRI